MILRRFLVVLLTALLPRVAGAIYVSPSGTIYETPEGEPVDIVISSDGSSYTGIIEFVPEAGLTEAFDSGPDVRGVVGGLQHLADAGYPDAWHFWAVHPLPDAAHFTFTYVLRPGDGCGVEITVYDDSWTTPVAWLVIPPVPEPGTAGLLTIGLLFVRRRG